MTVIIMCVSESSALATDKEGNGSLLQNYLVLSICIFIILGGAILIVHLIRRKRRMRFVNDSEVDVLYASSEEMLDLHLARST